MAEGETRETRGQIWGRLVKGAVSHKLVLEARWGDVSTKDKQQAEEGMATVRDEFRRTFLHRELTGLDELRQETFDAIVDMHVARHYARENEAKELAREAEEVARAIRERHEVMADDWDILHKEFPGQYPDRRVNNV